jgi:N-acetylglutamate synthase-like GNAT family acetyltransferase
VDRLALTAVGARFFYVAPEYRRRGVGAALIQAVVEKAAALGVETLYLSTVGREEYYASLGWNVIHRSEDKVVMSKATNRRKTSSVKAST